jgi:hypothetical protein
MRMRSVSKLITRWPTVDGPEPAYHLRVQTGRGSYRPARRLAHRKEADARVTPRRNADAVVDDLKFRVAFYEEPNNAALRLRMAGHVRQRLLRDAVDGHFDGGGQVGKVVRRFHRHARLLAFRTVALGEAAQGSGESKVVEGRGV